MRIEFGISWQLITAAMILLFVNAYSTQPELPTRNMEIEYKIIAKPEKLGDLLCVTWSFVLHKENDTIWQRFLDERYSEVIARVQFVVEPQQELIFGDSVWWAGIKYDTTYSRTVTYKIISESRLVCYPKIEMCKEMYNDSRDNRMPPNTEKPTVILIDGWDKSNKPNTDRKKGFVVDGDDTVFYESGPGIPEYQLKIGK